MYLYLYPHKTHVFVTHETFEHDSRMAAYCLGCLFCVSPDSLRLPPDAVTLKIIVIIMIIIFKIIIIIITNRNLCHPTKLNECWRRWKEVGRSSQRICPTEGDLYQWLFLLKRTDIPRMGKTVSYTRAFINAKGQLVFSF